MAASWPQGRARRKPRDSQAAIDARCATPVDRNFRLLRQKHNKCFNTAHVTNYYFSTAIMVVGLSKVFGNKGF
jgi:hypothetical protein